MNYERIYEEFIADRRKKEPAFYRGLSYHGRKIKEKRARKRSETLVYAEQHHIKATFDGGRNDASNVVSLSHRDHVFAHLCLAKIHGGRHWAALFAVTEMYRVPHMQRSVSAVIANQKMAERIRKEMSVFQRGANNKRANTIVYEWWNVKTGEHRNATRHEMPFSGRQANDYLSKGKTHSNTKWPVRFAAGEWYVLGISHKSHAEAQEDYSNRQLRNSERQRGKRRGSNNHNSTPILCVDTGIIYESQGMAADATGAHQSKISECCRGNRKSAGGYRWSFVS